MTPTTVPCRTMVRANNLTSNPIRRNSQNAHASIMTMLIPTKYGVETATKEDTDAALARPNPLTTAPPTQQAPPTAPQPAPAPAERRSPANHERTGPRLVRP